MIGSLLLAIGLVLALEGALYALFAPQLRGVFRQLETVSDTHLRIFGGGAFVLGFILIWILETI